MRILEINWKKGFVKIIPESFDDFWHLYNVIYRNDEVFAYTRREVRPDEKYARPGRGERVSALLGVKVEEVSWDKLLGRLRVHGTITEAPDSIPTGAHHTLSIALNTPLTIVKEKWPKHQIDRLQQAMRTSEKPIILVSIDDEGFAIARTAQYGVEVRLEERIRLPGKLEAENRGNALNEYFAKTVSGLREIWCEERYPIVIIGVGFVKNDFAKYLQNEAPDIAKSVADVKSVNNGGVVGIHEALRSGILLKTFKQMRAAEESEVIEEVLKRLGKSEATVAYGYDEVETVTRSGAVEKLVLADTALRESSDDRRLALEGVMKEVEQKGGSVVIVSTEHEAGTKLLGLGGVAAILRFPIG